MAVGGTETPLKGEPKSESLHQPALSSTTAGTKRTGCRDAESNCCAVLWQHRYTTLFNQLCLRPCSFPMAVPQPAVHKHWPTNYLWFKTVNGKTHFSRCKDVLVYRESYTHTHTFTPPHRHYYRFFYTLSIKHLILLTTVLLLWKCHRSFSYFIIYFVMSRNCQNSNNKVKLICVYYCTTRC